MLKEGIRSNQLNVQTFEADSPQATTAQLRIWLNEGKEPIHDITFLQNGGKTIAIVIYRGAIR